MTFGHEFTGIVEQIGPEVRNLTLEITFSFLLTSRPASASFVSKNSTGTVMSRIRKPPR